MISPTNSKQLVYGPNMNLEEIFKFFDGDGDGDGQMSSRKMPGVWEDLLSDYDVSLTYGPNMNPEEIFKFYDGDGDGDGGGGGQISSRKMPGVWEDLLSDYDVSLTYGPNMNLEEIFKFYDGDGDGDGDGQISSRKMPGVWEGLLSDYDVSLLMQDFGVDDDFFALPGIETPTMPVLNLNSSECCENRNEVLLKVFQRFDANGDGKISSEDLGRVLKAFEYDISDYEVALVMREIDRDGDGFINLGEFVSFCQGSTLCGMGDDGEVGELHTAFKLYDQDGDGFISVSDLHQILTLVGVGCSAQDCANVIRSVDADGDGTLSFEEFKEMMSNANKTEAQLVTAM